MIPLLLKPAWQAVKRHWQHDVEWSKSGGRDVILLAFGFIIMAAIYRGTLWALMRVGDNPTLAYLPPAHFIGLILGLLLVMLTISSVMAAVGSLFMAEDLELVTAAPISHLRFFVGKLSYVLLSSSWMPFVFILPLLLAFGEAYNAGVAFYLVSIVALVPYFVIPAAAALALATILVLVMPVHRVREMVLLVVVALLGVIYFLIDAISLEWNSLRGAKELLRVLSVLSMSDVAWLPSNWVAGLVQEFLKPTGSSWSILFGVLYAVCAAICALSYMITKAGREHAYSRAKNRRQGRALSSQKVQALVERMAFFVSPHFRAIFGKEIRVMARDLSQAVQLLMLLGISMIYLYHLRVFAVVDAFPDNIKVWWKNFLFLGNVCMGAFITTAICTRFVFPSLSLEGKSYWILQCSPMQIGEIMRIKFWSWLLPIGLIAGVFFASGAFAIGADARMILLNALSSIVLSYGVIGLAIGLGAVFARFDWEQSSQLAAGFGNFVFMLFSVILIFLNMVPAWMLLFVRPRGFSMLLAQAYLFIALNALLIVAINYFVARIAMRKGEQALLRQMN